MAEKKVEKAKDEVRREREAAIWKDRRDAGREVDAPKQTSTYEQTEGNERTTSRARQRQAPGM